MALRRRREEEEEEEDRSSSKRRRERDDDEDRGTGRRAERDRERSKRRDDDEEEERETRSSRGSSSRSKRGDREGGRKRYGYHSQEAINKRASQQGGQRDYFIKDEFPVLAVKSSDKGMNLRILPATWDNPDHWGLDVYVHFGIGPDNAAYLCLEKMKGEKCPVCEERKLAEKGGDAEYIKSLAPVKRVIMYAIDRADEAAGPKVWPAPWTVDKDICKQAIDKQTGDLYFIDDPEEGYDVHLDREGEKMKTKYFVSIARRSTPLGKEAKQEEWLEFIEQNPLTEVLNYFDYEHIKNVFAASDPLGEEEEEEEKHKRSSKNKRNEEPEREEEEEEERVKSKYTYDQIQDINKRAKLEDIALDEDLVDGAELDDMSISDLKDAICESLDLKPPRKETSSKGSKERMRNMRNRS